MKPFRDYDTKNLIEKKQEEIRREIDSFTNDEIISNDLTLLADNLYAKHYIEPVTIYEEDLSKRDVVQKKITRTASEIDRVLYNKPYFTIEGIQFTFYITCIGYMNLFRYQANTFSFSPYPEIEVIDNFIVISYEYSMQEADKEQFKNQITKRLSEDINRLRDGISYANKDIIAYNNSIVQYSLELLNKKKKLLEQFISISQTFEVPIEKSEYTSKYIEVKRKIRPITHKSNNQPSYCISDASYKEILTIIRHTLSAYEKTPSSYLNMKEEDLRNTLLATLNTYYPRGVTGETFRKKGKTDICIEYENQAAFVAECKIWKGQAKIEEALKQLDGYLHWRDCKTALIYFVRNKDFMKIIETANHSLSNISMIRKVYEFDKNEFACEMVSENNLGQIVQVQVMLFNLYC